MPRKKYVLSTKLLVTVAFKDILVPPFLINFWFLYLFASWALIVVSFSLFHPLPCHFFVNKCLFGPVFQPTVPQIKAEMEKTLQWLVPIAADTTKYVE